MKIFRRLIIAFFLICKFLCVPSSISAQDTTNNGAGNEEIFARADSLAVAGESFAAAVAYEYIFISYPDREIQVEALFRKAKLQKSEGLFSEAKSTFERIDLFQQSDSLQDIIRYELALNAYLSENFGEAESQLIQLEYFTKDSSMINQILFLKILILNEQQKWVEARQEFIRYIEINNLNLDPEEVYYFAEKPKLRNPKRAQWFSTFVPGSGQIYGGAPLSGIASFLIQAGSLAFGGYYIWQGYYFRAFFTGFATFQTFYFGGVNNAAYVTKKRNEEKVRKYNDSVREIILNIERQK